MKKLILVTIIIYTFGLGIYAQQDPMYTQYMFNTLSVNPAYASTKDALNAVIISRHQWVGFDGAPSTNSITLMAPVPKSGLSAGFSYFKDKIGPLEVSNTSFDVSSKVRLTWEGFLSLGLKMAFDVRKTSFTQLNTTTDDDPKFNTDLKSRLSPNIGLGLFYFTQSYYAGFSVPKAINRNIKSKDLAAASEKIERHFFLMGGYEYVFDEEFKFRPSFLLRKVKAAPSSFDLSIACEYKEKVIVGLSCRFGDSFGAMVQFNAYEQIWLGYAYDLTTSSMRKYNSGTHELMLYIDSNLFRKGAIKLPQFF